MGMRKRTDHPLVIKKKKKNVNILELINYVQQNMFIFTLTFQLMMQYHRFHSLIWRK